MSPPIRYLALHEIFPTGPAGAVLAGIIYSGFIGFLALLVLWRRRRSSSDRRRPPLRLILAIGFMVGWLPFVLMGERSIVLPEWIVGSLWCAGNLATLWWLWDRLSPRKSISEEPSTPPPIPDATVRSARDACGVCQASAAAGGGPPLSRVAHNADGPRFLYRCAQCHSYWEKDVKGMRPISALRVRQEFPAVVI